MIELSLSLVVGAATLWWILTPPSRARRVLTPRVLVVRIKVDFTDFIEGMRALQQAMNAFGLSIAETTERHQAFVEAWRRTMEVIDAPDLSD